MSPELATGPVFRHGAKPLASFGSSRPTAVSVYGCKAWQEDLFCFCRDIFSLAVSIELKRHLI
jgi:hypothetical protein